jgi:hypothetical protein
MRLLSVIAMLLAAGPSFAAETRKAQSEAEKALEAILAWHIGLPVDMNEQELAFLTGRPEQRAALAPQFARRYAPELVNAVRAGEKALLDKDCQGKYQDGEICGLDYDVVLCAQDRPAKGFLFTTLKEDGTSATIAVRWSRRDKQPAATYQIAKQAEGWTLSGISCGEGKDALESFNFKR